MRKPNGGLIPIVKDAAYRWDICTSPSAPLERLASKHRDPKGINMMQANEKTETSLFDLAERCERAVTEEQSALLDEAFYAIHGTRPPRIHGGSDEMTAWLAVRNPFYGMMEAKAYESAALLLLPGPDWEWSLEWETGSDGEMFARCALGDPMRHRDCEAPTLALAICAAALRAIAAST
jgi:hypothetical protein